MTVEEKKGACQCRKCNGVFNQSEIKRVQREHSGKTSIDNVCPHCESTNFGLIEYPVTEEFNTYKSHDFFRKKLR